MKIFKEDISSRCPNCDEGHMKKVVRKNYYHGRKSSCRKTFGLTCTHCCYGKMLGRAE